MRRFPRPARRTGYLVQRSACDAVAQLERVLRRRVPLSRPVSVRMVCGLASSGVLGQQGSAFDPRRRRMEFVIELDAELTRHEAIDTLLHEWAHALSHGAGGETHNAAWGRAYARCYRASLRKQ